ncbi:hypothetical protein ACVOMV_08735 [Mesorhizobium atlanticum]
MCRVVPPRCTIRGAVPTSNGNGCTCPDGTHLDRIAKACVPDETAAGPVRHPRSGPKR